MRQLLVIWAVIGISFSSVGQSRLTDEMKETEEQLASSNKQINQFFRRFNGEEDQEGKRYYPADKKYRDGSVRKKFLPGLFDQETSQFDQDQLKSFLSEVIDKKNPSFLDFHNDNWFAEVSTDFTFKGKTISGLLYMRLQKQGQGYEWVIEEVAFDIFQSLFDKDTSEQKKFLHPMSHELDFMTLRKGLQDNKHAEQFTSRSFKPDYLSIFIYELNQGNLKFKSVREVKYHFFAIDGWYFSLSNFNRPGYNSGWLVSNLVPIPNASFENQLKDYIYDRN